MTNQREKKKGIKVYIPLILVIILVLGGSVYWFIEYSKYIRTDDAHIDAHDVTVSSKVMGRISEVFADEGDMVKKGQLLAVLDSTDLVVQKKQALASKLQVEASVAQAEAQHQFNLKNNKVLEIALEKSQTDYERAKSQYEGGVITLERFENAQKDLQTAQAQLEASRSQEKVSAAAVTTSKAALSSAEAQIDVIQNQINNCKLYAPNDGVIGRRWLLPGDIASVGQSIYTVLDDQNIWVSVFIEETNLQELYEGESVLFTVDAYPDETFTGKIFELGSNTASLFSLIPASNASGNFTKVTQRVQLKVSIDGTTEGSDLSSFRLLSGMSAVVRIIR